MHVYANSVMYGCLNKTVHTVRAPLATNSKRLWQAAGRDTFKFSPLLAAGKVAGDLDQETDR